MTPDGQGDDRLPEKAPKRQGGEDHREVQDDGREGRRGEMPERIEDPHAEGDERDEEDVGEHEPGKEDGEVVLGGRLDETGRHDRHDERGEEDAQERNDDEDDRQGREGDVRQFQRLLAGFVPQVFGEDGDEGDGQRPLGEEPPEEVRDPEGDEEGVGRETRAEEAGHDHVPDKAEDAGEHRGDPHDPCRPDDPRIFGTAFRLPSDDLSTVS